MARSNYLFTGLRWYRNKFGGDKPNPIPCVVADNYATALYPGDPVAAVNDGTVAQCAAGGAVFGVIHSVLQLKNSDSVLVRNALYVPANTRWTNHADRTIVMVIPAREAEFKVQADDGSSITTLAAALSCVGENADHTFASATASAALGLSACLLDISTHNTTNTLGWRIVDALTDTMPGSDPTVTRHTYIVSANLLNNEGATVSATGV